MMKVLLVDDEMLTIRMFQNLIPWNEWGLELVGYAQSGQQALEMIIKDLPDIIISDIKMPGMNGLDLLEIINDLSLNIKTILVSAYADFSYVKEAMKLGGSDYILKPVDEAELGQAIRKVLHEIEGMKEQEKVVANSVKQVNKINLYRYMKTGHGLNKILKSDPSYGVGMKRFSLFLVQMDYGSINDYDMTQNIQMVQGGYIIKILEKNLSRYMVESSIFDYEDSKWFIFLEDILSVERHEIAKEIIDWLIKEAGIHVNVYFSTFTDELRKLPILYKEVKNLSKYSFYIGDESVIGYGYNCDRHDLDQVRNVGILKDMEKALSDRNTQDAFAIINEIFSLSSNDSPEDKKYIYDLCKQIVELTHRLIPTYMNENIKEYRTVGTLKKLKRTMIDFIETIPEMSEGQAKKDSNKAVEEGKRLIEERYNENLSLDEICSEIAISKNYFCYLFKRETGMSIWNYLTIVRLQHAKRLLEETQLRSYEIAFRVGYDNPSYFSKLFKKYELQSPNEYRKHKR